jgi:hypothetical protein
MFGSAEAIEELIDGSKVLKKYFENNLEQEMVCMLLAMSRTEKTVLGMEIDGDVVKREVAPRWYWGSAVPESPSGVDVAPA